MESKMPKYVDCMTPRFRDARRALESAHNDVVEHRKPGKRLDDLKRPRYACRAHLIRPQTVEVRAIEMNFTGIRREGSGYHIKERRFAGTVGTDERNEGASFHRD
jgi:hypothetical protein